VIHILNREVKEFGRKTIYRLLPEDIRHILSTYEKKHVWNPSPQVVRNVSSYDKENRFWLTDESDRFAETPKWFEGEAKKILD
jgi:hypothetical protein